MKTALLSVLYFVIGAGYIVLESHIPCQYAVLNKGMIVPVLLIILVINLKQNFDRLSWLMLAGLIFSCAGDIILNFSFVPGLVCFLMAHVMYLLTFWMTPGENVIVGRKLYLLLIVILYGIGLVYFLYDDLAEMKIPVIIYATVILSMLSLAINRLGKVNKTSYLLVLCGAVLFVLSDSTLAINRFSLPFRSSDIVIMSTYIIAQYLITTGFIRQYRENFV
ncbi:MAG: lysoplasmalogenase [Bacteroidota bacterium]|nr:lysoplasmalogenase [Bacteroidota bacterium]